MKKMMIVGAMLLAVGMYSCTKEEVTTVEDTPENEEIRLYSSTQTGFAYRASDGNVYLLNDESKVPDFELFIQQQEQDIADGIMARPKLKFQSSKCTAPDGSRGLKCEKTKKGDCQNEFDCVSAGDAGDY